MQPGWNLGNTFDAIDWNDPTIGGDETSWGNPRVTKECAGSEGTISLPVPY